MSYSYWNGVHWNGPWPSARYVDMDSGSPKTPWTVYKVGKRVTPHSTAKSPNRLLVLLCKR